MNQKIFHGGVPTDIDVRILMDKYGVPEIGKEITWVELNEVLHNPEKNRFNAVVGSWRKKLLREYSIEMIAVRGVGLRAGTAAERIERRVKEIDINRRASNRVVKRIAFIPVATLTEKELKMYDCLGLTALRIATAVQSEVRQFALRPTKSLPASLLNK